MTSIALVTEGKSEHWIIKHIVGKYFKDKEVFFRQVQPQIVDDTQESDGGWLEVLKFCERSEDLKSALIESDYLIIQIDTDESVNPNFDVAHTKQGSVLKTDEELYNDIIAKINGLINSGLKIEDGDKIIFAICIHTIECWLLPIYYTDNHKSNTRNCLSTLNVQLRRKNLDVIPSKKQKRERQRAYENVLKNWKRKKEIVSASQHNEGFKKFIDSLKVIEGDVL